MNSLPAVFITLAFVWQVTSVDFDVYLFYTGANSQLHVANNRLTNGGFVNTSFSDSVVSNTYLSYGPTALNFSSEIYIFYKGYNNEELYFKIATPISDSLELGFNSAQELTIYGSSAAGVAVAAYTPTIMAIYKQDNGSLFWSGYNYNTRYANTWTPAAIIAGSYASATPSAAIWDEAILFVFYQGPNNSGELRYNIWDPLATIFGGTGWTDPDFLVPNTGITNGPSVVISGDIAYVFHQGAGGNGELWFNTNDVSTPNNPWSGDTQITPLPQPLSGTSGPSAFAYDGSLWVIYTGSNQSLYYLKIDFSGNVLASGFLSGTDTAYDTPSVVLFHP